VIGARSILALSAASAMLILSCRPALAEDRLELWPQLAVTEQYTDNLLLTATNAESDEITTAIGGGSLAFTNAERNVKLDYLTDGQLYAQNSGLDRGLQDHYVGFSDRERLSGETELSMDDTFIKGQPIFGQALVGPTGVSLQLGQALLQKEFLTNSFSANLNQEFSDRFSTALAVHQTYYSLNQAATNNESYAQGCSLTLAYHLTPVWSALLGYDFEDFRFSSSPTTDTHEPFVGLSYNLTRELTLTASGGPVIEQTSSSTRVDAAYIVSAAYTTERLQATLESARQESTTAGFGGAGINQSVGGSISYALTRRCNAFVNNSYSQLNQGSAASDILSWSAGINYRLTRPLTVFAQYLGFRTTSPTSPPVVTNSVLAGMRLTAQPWRWVW
jgi:hypothetical protein